METRQVTENKFNIEDVMERFDKEHADWVNACIAYNELHPEKEQVLSFDKEHQWIKTFFLQSNIDYLENLMEKLENRIKTEIIEIKTKEDRDPFDGETIIIPYDQEEARKLSRKATLQDTIDTIKKDIEKINKLI